MLCKPFSFISNSVHKLFYRNSVDLYRTNLLDHLVSNTFIALLAFILPFALLIIIGGEYIFISIFGQPWRESGSLASLIIIWVLFQFCTGSLITIFFTLEKQYIATIMQAAMLIVRLGCLFIGYKYYNYYDTVKLYCIGSATCYIIFAFVVFYYTKINIFYTLKIILKYTLFALIVCVPWFLFINFNVVIYYKILILIIFFYY